MRARRLRRPSRVREKLIRREERRLARLKANGDGVALERYTAEAARRKKKSQSLRRLRRAGITKRGYQTKGGR